ncbi:hypothetical protein [Streptomyces drozdowiczii]|uniref:Uncharacterized protein n=1 Tax=Streptomyces drozdowiczii TaxID=202862 RepID=A0ABY6PKE9_9ACTN|nr:hypothetical protein [Streptomyces drozdowiczii]MCX0247884.1 hypothetical protein [Streptomyces drozdowiczii]UZK52757.1 hypothetical protein NEH16_00300 [Streptomyces drozdowiczii]
MTEQTIHATNPAIEDAPAAAPRTGSFAPQLSAHPVAILTLGRQVFNDSDKSNYFEG